MELNYTILPKTFYYILKHDANEQILTYKYKNGYYFKRIIKLNELFKRYSISFIISDNLKFKLEFDFSIDHDEILDLHYHIRSLKQNVSYINEQIIEVENTDWFKKYKYSWLSNYEYKLYKDEIERYKDLIFTYNIVRDELDDNMLDYDKRVCNLINSLIISNFENSEKIENTKKIIDECKYILHIPETLESAELEIPKYTHIIDFVRNKITTIDQYGNVKNSIK